MGAGSATYYIKSVKKPGLKVSTKEHMYLGHKFKYPGLVTWEPPELDVKMIDPVSPDAAATLTAIIQAAGYIVPANEGTLTTVSKQRAATALGAFVITVLDEAGTGIETWTLKNAFITGVDFGDLDYSKEDLSEVTLKVSYDWCELNTINPADSAAMGQLAITTGNPAVSANNRFKPE
jgi:hypothetical protein